MSDATPTPDQHLHYAIMDKWDNVTRATSRADAIRSAKQWDKEHPKFAPHRAVAIIARQVLPR